MQMFRLANWKPICFALVTKISYVLAHFACILGHSIVLIFQWASALKGPYGPRPVIVKMALIGSKGGWEAKHSI